MPFKKFDRVQETTATTGTGDITLSGAVTGFRTFASVLAVGDTFPYAIADGDAWETGYGKMLSTTVMERTLDASSTGTLLVLTGSANVYLSPIAKSMRSDVGKHTCICRAIYYQ